MEASLLNLSYVSFSFLVVTKYLTKVVKKGRVLLTQSESHGWEPWWLEHELDPGAQLFPLFSLAQEPSPWNVVLLPVYRANLPTSVQSINSLIEMSEVCICAGSKSHIVDR